MGVEIPVVRQESCVMSERLQVVREEVSVQSLIRSPVVAVTDFMHLLSPSMKVFFHKYLLGKILKWVWITLIITCLWCNSTFCVADWLYDDWVITLPLLAYLKSSPGVPRPVTYHLSTESLICPVASSQLDQPAMSWWLLSRCWTTWRSSSPSPLPKQRLTSRPRALLKR